jgi:hypothetical protein
MVTCSGTEDEPQRAACALNGMPINYSSDCFSKAEAVAVIGKMNVSTNIIINNHIIEQINGFIFLSYTIPVTNNRDLEIEMSIFSQMCGTVRWTLNNVQETIHRYSHGSTYIYMQISHLY